MQKYVEDPLSEALIQGALPRPGELEVFLGDAGIYWREIREGEEEELVGVGAQPLYKF